MNLVVLVASILFAISVYGILSSRNMARILIYSEVMFNAFVLAIIGYLASISPYVGPESAAYVSVFVVIAILLAVSEIIVTFSILIALLRYKVVKRIDTEEKIIRDLALGGEEK